MARILFVEDDPDLLVTYGLILENRGHHVTSFRTGEEALEFLSRVAPDIIVCDMALPGMDGAAVCRHIKENKRTRCIPLILFTCVRVKYGINISERDRTWIPADRIIDKGETAEALIKALEELLKGVKS